jgi:phosphate uptake regulator
MPFYKVRLRKVLQNLPGVEIILDEPQRIIAKSFLDENEVNISEILTRIRSILLSMIGDLELIAQNPSDSEVLKDVTDLENELDRFYFLVIRTVSRLLSQRAVAEESGIIKRNFDLIGILLIVRNIERIGDHITRIAENPERLDFTKLRKFFVEVLDRIEDKDLKKIDRLMLDLRSEIEAIDSKESVAKESYRRILEYLENVGETIINMAIG